MKKLLALALIVSISAINAFAGETLCEQKIEDVLKSYKEQGKPVESYQIKDCSNVTDPMGPLMDEEMDTKAPKVIESSACAIVLNLENKKLQELVIYDEMNNFYLERTIENSENESFDISRFGDKETGTILFIKAEGTRGKDEDGFLKNHKYITKSVYDLESNTIRLVKWRLHFFWNKYSHDYTVQCQ